SSSAKAARDRHASLRAGALYAPGRASGSEARAEMGLRGVPACLGGGSMSGIVRGQQMLVSWRSDDTTAKYVKEFVEMVMNAVTKGLMERERDEALTPKPKEQG